MVVITDVIHEQETKREVRYDTTITREELVKWAEEAIEHVERHRVLCPVVKENIMQVARTVDYIQHGWWDEATQVGCLAGTALRADPGDVDYLSNHETRQYKAIGMAFTYLVASPGRWRFSRRDVAKVIDFDEEVQEMMDWAEKEFDDD